MLHSNGVAWVFLFILVVAAADSGAYFVGKSRGKTLLLPRLSWRLYLSGNRFNNLFVLYGFRFF